MSARSQCGAAILFLTPLSLREWHVRRLAITQPLFWLTLLYRLVWEMTREHALASAKSELRRSQWNTEGRTKNGMQSNKVGETHVEPIRQ
jgi:hypothetical protein